MRLILQNSLEQGNKEGQSFACTSFRLGDPTIIDDRLATRHYQIEDEKNANVSHSHVDTLQGRVDSHGLHLGHILITHTLSKGPDKAFVDAELW